MALALTLSRTGHQVIKLAVFVGTSYELKWSYREKIFNTYSDKVARGVRRCGEVIVWASKAKYVRGSMSGEHGAPQGNLPTRPAGLHPHARPHGRTDGRYISMLDLPLYSLAICGHLFKPSALDACTC